MLFIGGFMSFNASPARLFASVIVAAFVFAARDGELRPIRGALAMTLKTSGDGRVDIVAPAKD
jgi:hypothetical protein